MRSFPPRPPIGPFQLPNPFMLAPMAGVSERPFRVIAYRLGAALCPTELVSAAGLRRANARTLKYLRYDPEVEQPYSLQLFGGDPDEMAQAARTAAQHGAQLIDINMGCPVKKVTRSGAGSALLCDPPRAAEIVRRIRDATGLSVTAKIRAGWDASRRNYLEMLEHLEAAGCAALAVHPRTRTQGYAGRADWSVIAELKRHASIPIIGNGDVRSVDDAYRMLDETGCDFVMIGRGALGNPWLFRELLGGPAPTVAERCELVLSHFREHVAFVVEGYTQRGPDAARRLAVREFRRPLGWYSHGLFGAAQFRAQAMKLELPEQVERAVADFFSKAPKDQGGDAGEPDVDYQAALG